MADTNSSCDLAQVSAAVLQLCTIVLFNQSDYHLTIQLQTVFKAEVPLVSVMY